MVGEKAKEAAALKADINGQGAVRENHYDMDGADDY